MTTLDTPTSLGATGYDNADLQQKAKDHLWMHFARQSTMETSGVPIIARGEGHHIFDVEGRKYFDGLSGLFVVNAGHGRAAPRRGRREAGRAARVLPDLVVRAPGGHRARRPPGRLRARRPQPRVLLHRRRRGGRDGVQAREVLLEAQGPAHQAQGDLARGRLPRHTPGRPGDHRHPGDEGDVRAASRPVGSACPTRTSTVPPRSVRRPTTSRPSASGRPTASRR